MPVFILHGVEHIYDAFDEYEHANKIVLRVSEESFTTVLECAHQMLQSYVNERRAGFFTSGMFFTDLIRIEDETGRILFQDLDAIKGLVRWFGGNLEDYRDPDWRDLAIFLSYSHKDEQFATRFREGITEKGHRLWFDRTDIDTELQLLRYRFTDPYPDEIIKDVLRNAMQKAQGLILLLSNNSNESMWVHWEVDLALKMGLDRHGLLSCVLLDPGILEDPPAWLKFFNSENIHDFSRWQEPSAFDTMLHQFLEKPL